jgi:hypothetical protein
LSHPFHSALLTSICCLTVLLFLFVVVAAVMVDVCVWMCAELLFPRVLMLKKANKRRLKKKEQASSSSLFCPSLLKEREREREHESERDARTQTRTRAENRKKKKRALFFFTVRSVPLFPLPSFSVQTAREGKKKAAASMIFLALFSI